MSVDLSLSRSDALATINKQGQGTSKTKLQQAVDIAVTQDATATKTNATRSFETVQQAAKAKELGDEKAQGLVNRTESTKPAEPVDREQLEVMAQQLQEFVSSLNRGLEFSVDEDSGRNVIKVIDKNDGKLVRQYPSEEVLELVANLSDAAGNLINSKV